MSICDSLIDISFEKLFAKQGNNSNPASFEGLKVKEIRNKDCCRIIIVTWVFVFICLMSTVQCMLFWPVFNKFSFPISKHLKCTFDGYFQKKYPIAGHPSDLVFVTASHVKEHLWCWLVQIGLWFYTEYLTLHLHTSALPLV